MDIWKTFNKLCAPAQLYLVISLMSIFGMLYQNYDNPQQYCVGLYKTKSICDNRVYFALKFLYVVVWLFILQKLCSKGYKTISWLIVLLPIIGMFILIGLLFIFLMKKTNIITLI
jgi:hypothetical protein